MKKAKECDKRELKALIEACEEALTYISELLIDNKIDKGAKKISDKLYSALKQFGRV